PCDDSLTLEELRRAVGQEKLEADRRADRLGGAAGDEQTAARDVGREPLDECGDIGILEPDPHLGRRPAGPGSLLRHRCSRKPEYPLGKAPCQFVARRLAAGPRPPGAPLPPPPG